MYDSWKGVFTELKKFKRRLLDTLDSDTKSTNLSSFVNHFILQIFVLWVLQKLLFFDRDKAFFKKAFRSVKEKQRNFPYRSFYHFLIAFLEEAKNLDDFVVKKISSFGVLIGCNSAIFLNLEFFNDIISIPDDFFSNPLNLSEHHHHCQ